MPNEVIKHCTTDRVTFSMSRKINVAQYESFDIHLGYGQDKQQGETETQAMQRVEKMVMSEFDRLMGMIDTGKIKAAKK